MGNKDTRFGDGEDSDDIIKLKKEVLPARWVRCLGSPRGRTHAAGDRQRRRRGTRGVLRKGMDGGSGKEAK